MLDHKPCNLCLIERIPYIASVILISLIFILNKFERIISIIILLFFIFGAIVSFYHFGIEQGFIKESLVCDLNNENKSLTVEELLKELKEKTISCKDVTFRILGLSLATINTLISLLFSVIILKTFLNYEKNKQFGPLGGRLGKAKFTTETPRAKPRKTKYESRKMAT